VTTTIATDLCIIGAGSGGLSLAAVAAQLGVGTVLIERGRMGGDCLNYGCVPSKALIAAARAAHGARTATAFGVDAEPKVDFARVHRHIHDVIAEIAPLDSVERFAALGVRVVAAEAAFVGPREVAAGDTRVVAKRFVIATGSSPLVPPIPGLADSDYLTNESIFDLTQLPAHLIVVGGGPIGVELGQAFRRLGAAVSIVEAGRVLPADEPEMAEQIVTQLRREGIEVLEGATVTQVEGKAGSLRVTATNAAGARTLAGSHVLVAAGRRASVPRGLDAAGIAYDKTGIALDRALRTTNRRVFAVGDAAGGLKFTHFANYQAIGILQNVLLPFALPVKARPIPWVTYTEPELAHVGLTEAAARDAGHAVNVLRGPFAENDRAKADRATAGHIKIVTDRRDRVLGVSILGAHAGELIVPWTMMIGARQRSHRLLRTVFPYPTYSEVSRRAAASGLAPRLLNPATRRWVKFLLRFI
jgi:pyruvate/2-oxoglutarate dehydrogenase complex dihydrolipoamide dehydrogenase (E3) component